MTNQESLLTRDMTDTPAPTTHDETIPQALDRLRAAIRAETISYGEIAELNDLAEHIDPDDDELLSWIDEPEDEPKDIWAMLEEPAPAGCGAVQDLYSWSLNYDPGKGPFAFFLDAIGWSDDNLGEPVCHPGGSRWGYVELRKLADALTEYVDQSYTVAEYVDALMAAEAR